MHTITYKHSSGVTTLLIQNGLAEAVGEKALEFVRESRRAVIVTDRNVAKVAASKVERALQKAGFQVKTVILPSGERQKNLNNAKKLYDILLAHGMERWSPIFALGGGVVGDLTGFVASTYMRGIPFFQIPTTLLAQVDASIGGKTAVNLPEGKNLVGCFYQPKAIFTDPLLLATLSDRDLSAGLGEVIKFGMIRDATFFSFLQKNIPKVLSREPAVLEAIVAQTASLKASIVEGDEKEQGDRVILNYGHTIGHAVEALSSYNRYRHGEAVAIGMECEAMMAVEIGLASPRLFEMQNEVFKQCHLPTRAHGLRSNAIIHHISTDKKRKGGTTRFVLPEIIGKVRFPVIVPEGILRKAVRYVCR